MKKTEENLNELGIPPNETILSMRVLGGADRQSKGAESLFKRNYGLKTPQILREIRAFRYIRLIGTHRDSTQRGPQQYIIKNLSKLKDNKRF